MTDRAKNDAVTANDASLETERAVARVFSRGLPIATLLAAIGARVTMGLGPAILALAGGVLLGVVGFVWASLRTLSGDAPLPADVEALIGARNSDASEKKRTLLRALKDLENEHAIGKLDDADFAEVALRYRTEAKDLMRAMDAEIEPLRAKAEEAARAYLKKRGLTPSDEPIPPPSRDDLGESDESHANEPENDEVPTAKARVACYACSVSNEPDAKFCKACGASFARSLCSSCGVSNEPDAKFCKKCGSALAAPTAANTSEARNA